MTTNHPTPWRQGRKVPRNIYDANDQPIVMMPTEELAAHVVEAVNLIHETAGYLRSHLLDDEECASPDALKRHSYLARIEKFLGLPPAPSAPPTREQAAEGPTVAERLCGIPSAMGWQCDAEWGHDGDMHQSHGDGYYARAQETEHHRRQALRVGGAEPAEAGEPGDEELRTLYYNASRVYAGTPLHGHAEYPHLGYRALFDHGRAFERERLNVAESRGEIRKVVAVQQVPSYSHEFPLRARIAELESCLTEAEVARDKPTPCAGCFVPIKPGDPVVHAEHWENVWTLYRDMEQLRNSHVQLQCAAEAELAAAREELAEAHELLSDELTGLKVEIADALMREWAHVDEDKLPPRVLDMKHRIGAISSNAPKKSPE